eukprot:6478664-Amphidinium_carterae.2
MFLVRSFVANSTWCVCCTHVVCPSCFGSNSFSARSDFRVVVVHRVLYLCCTSCSRYGKCLTKCCCISYRNWGGLNCLLFPVLHGCWLIGARAARRLLLRRAARAGWTA